MVADQDQTRGLAVARMIREGLHRAPRTQRLHAQPDGAGAVPHVFIVIGRVGYGVLCRPRSDLGVRSCRVPDSAQRRAGYRDPAPLPSGPRSPPRARGDNRVAPDARASVRFLACNAPSRNGCGSQSPRLPRAGPRRPVCWAAALGTGAPATPLGDAGQALPFGRGQAPYVLQGHGILIGTDFDGENEYNLIVLPDHLPSRVDIV